MTGVFWTGFASGLVLIVAIGSQNAFLLRQGLLRQHVMALVLFCSLSDALLILLGVAGAGALIQGKPEWLQASRYAGALFLAVYAFFAARRVFRPEPLLASNAEAPTLRTALLLCFGFTFLNPHVYLDAVVLLGSMANQYAQPAQWWFGAGAVFSSLCWFSALGFGSRWLQPWFENPRAWQWLDGLIACTMLALAWNLAMG
jgi:L-lysine exporter family protein LysE/ArgO